MPDLLSTVDAAEMIGCTPRWVQYLARSGQLEPAAKLTGNTGAYVFEAAVVRMYLAHKRPRARKGAGARTRSRQSEEATAS